jgi:5'-nucleotidase
MRFLLTNDDGIYARGLPLCIANCPWMPNVSSWPRSGAERRGARHHAVQAADGEKRPEERQALGYAVAGTPADCVKIGIRELAGGPWTW